MTASGTQELSSTASEHPELLGLHAQINCGCNTRAAWARVFLRIFSSYTKRRGAVPRCDPQNKPADIMLVSSFGAPGAGPVLRVQVNGASCRLFIAGTARMGGWVRGHRKERWHHWMKIHRGTTFSTEDQRAVLPAICPTHNKVFLNHRTSFLSTQTYIYRSERFWVNLEVY